MLGLGFDHLEKLLATLQAPALHVHPEYCSRLRHKNSKCALCSDNCPVHAIEWTATLKVDPDSCTSCGICASVCPNGVFESLKPADVEILAKVKVLLHERQDIVFRCAGPKGTGFDNEKQSGSIRVPCLARLDEAVLVGAIASGAGSVRLVSGSCRGCRHESGRQLAEKTVSTANGILSLFGLSQRISFLNGKIEVEPLKESASEPATSSRREFFRSIARESQKAGALLAVSIMNSYTAQDADTPKKRIAEPPTRLPAKRSLLVSSMKGLGRLIEKAKESDSPLFGRFEIDENCNGCQMCAFFCPTGALQKVEEEGKAGVSFKVSDCTACGLCQEICYKQAVRLSHQVDIHKVMEGDTEVIIMREGPFVFQGQLLGKD